MSAILQRTLTVRCGPEVLGFIREIGRKKFIASLQSGHQLRGVFLSRGDAAQAIDGARKKERACKTAGLKT
ncbi:hypothetical protein ACVWZ3_008081 [Bradyrhizobium sp. i1.3.6]